MIEHATITVLVCFAVNICFTWDGMILSRLGDLIEAYSERFKIIDFVAQISYRCVPCMAFWYCPVLWFLLGNEMSAEILITCVASIGLGAIVMLFPRLIEAIENLEQFTDELQEADCRKGLEEEPKEVP